MTTRRNPLVCTGLTACKSPPTDTQGDHEGHEGGMGRPRGAALVLLSVFFPSFGLLLYYNTQASLETTTRTPSRTPDHHAYTQANTRPPRVHMVGGAPRGRSAGRTGRERISNMRPAKGKTGGLNPSFSNLFHSYKSGVWGRSGQLF